MQRRGTVSKILKILQTSFMYGPKWKRATKGEEDDPLIAGIYCFHSEQVSAPKMDTSLRRRAHKAHFKSINKGIRQTAAFD